MKLHRKILNGFQVTERTRLECKFCYFPFQRAITPKIRNPELLFLCSACRFILVKNHVKLHQKILNGFQVTERTRLECKFCYFPFQRAITPKIRNPELLFLCSACRFILVKNHVKLHQKILNGFQVTERTRLECKFCYFPFQRAITPKIRNPELWFLCPGEN